MYLISAIDLNLFQPLDLGITQKSLGSPKVILSYIKGGKGGKDHIRFNSFMSRLREGEQESKGDFWTVSCGVSAAEFQQRSNNNEVSAGQFFSKAEFQQG